MDLPEASHSNGLGDSRNTPAQDSMMLGTKIPSSVGLPSSETSPQGARNCGKDDYGGSNTTVETSKQPCLSITAAPSNDVVYPPGRTVTQESESSTSICEQTPPSRNDPSLETSPILEGPPVASENVGHGTFMPRVDDPGDLNGRSDSPPLAWAR